MVDHFRYFTLERLEKLMYGLSDEMSKINNRLDRIDASIIEDAEAKAQIRNTAYVVENIFNALKLVTIPNEDYVVTLDEIVSVIGKQRSAIYEALRRNGIQPANAIGKKNYYFKNEVYALYASSISNKMDFWLTLGKKWQK